MAETLTLPTPQTLPSAAASRTYQVCARCVMDTSDPEIEFDADGTCNHCKRAQNLLDTRLPIYQTGAYRLDRIVAAMKAAGRGKKYDCITGVSGGADSTYAAYVLVKQGLRPLAVHFDNGWNSELAVKNIEQTLNVLGVDLYTHVVDWEEFRDLQLAFLRASVPDAEIPTDHGIWALLHSVAEKFGIRYVVSGTNINTESILPRSWTYYVTDWKYIRGIHRQFGTRPLKTFPHASLARFAYWVLLRKIKGISILNSVPYTKSDVVATLERELGWRNYGGKHHESIYTRFFQSYILPNKFGIDKRKAHLSSLIVSGQMTRADAVRELEKPIADPVLVREDLIYVAKKFGLTAEEFASLMAQPRRSYRDYPNDSETYERAKAAVRWAQRHHLLPGQVGL
jgi:N-acetyl sugar amidotransferase